MKLLRPLLMALCLVTVVVPHVILTAGCASSAWKELSIDQRIKLAIDTQTAVNNTVTTALDAHLISSADAKNYRALAVNARAVLNSAWDLRASDIQTAEGQLKLADAILKELQKLLIARGAK